MGRITARRRVVRRTVGAPPIRGEDTVTVEEPLEIRVGHRTLTVTMRTPGHDVELAIGWLIAEGLIGSGDDVVTARYCAGATEDGVNTYNVLDIALAPGVATPDPQLTRRFATTSACGVCGTSSIEAVRVRSPFAVGGDRLEIYDVFVAGLPARLRAQQRVFAATGGLHAAGLFDAATGDTLVVREDVGRHNAVDKVIGWAAAHGRLPLTGTVLMVSSRASFELVQKAWLAGIPVLAAVSAASSLAVDLADEAGMTLVGFVRDESMVIYTGAQRIVTSSGAMARGQAVGPAVDVANEQAGDVR